MIQAIANFIRRFSTQPAATRSTTMKSADYINFVKEYAGLDAAGIREKFFVIDPKNPRIGHMNDGAVFKFIKDVKEVFNVKFFSEGTYSFLTTKVKDGYFYDSPAGITGNKIQVVDINGFYEISGEPVMDELQNNPDYDFIQIRLNWAGKEQFFTLAQFIKFLVTARLQACEPGDFDYDKYMESKDLQA